MASSREEVHRPHGYNEIDEHLEDISDISIDAPFDRPSYKPPKTVTPSVSETPSAKEDGRSSKQHSKTPANAQQPPVLKQPNAQQLPVLKQPERKHQEPQEPAMQELVQQEKKKKQATSKVPSLMTTHPVKEVVPGQPVLVQSAPGGSETNLEGSSTALSPIPTGQADASFDDDAQDAPYIPSITDYVTVEPPGTIKYSHPSDEDFEMLVPDPPPPKKKKSVKTVQPWWELTAEPLKTAIGNISKSMMALAGPPKEIPKDKTERLREDRNVDGEKQESGDKQESGCLARCCCCCNRRRQVQVGKVPNVGGASCKTPRHSYGASVVDANMDNDLL